MAVTWKRFAFAGANADITSMTGLDDDGIPVAKVAGAIETATLASAVIADNHLIAGDGGVRGVQERIVIVSDAGEMTNLSQPAFLAYLTLQEDNVTGDGTDWNTTTGVNNWTEQFDQGNNFDGDGLFTASVTGKYLFIFTIATNDVDAAHTREQVRIVTSNVSIVVEFNPIAIYSGDLIYQVTLLADMDANDTAYCRCTVRNGTKVVDIKATETKFSGVLIC